MYYYFTTITFLTLGLFSTIVLKEGVGFIFIGISLAISLVQKYTTSTSVENKVLHYLSLFLLLVVTSGYSAGNRKVVYLDAVLYHSNLQGDSRKKIVNIIKEDIDECECLKWKKRVMDNFKNKDIIAYTTQKINEIEKKRYDEEMKNIQEKMDKLKIKDRVLKD